jgi:hypothetical protein
VAGAQLEPADVAAARQTDLPARHRLSRGQQIEVRERQAHAEAGGLGERLLAGPERERQGGPSRLRLGAGRHLGGRAPPRGWWQRPTVTALDVDADLDVVPGGSDHQVGAVREADGPATGTDRLGPAQPTRTEPEPPRILTGEVAEEAAQRRVRGHEAGADRRVPQTRRVSELTRVEQAAVLGAFAAVHAVPPHRERVAHDAAGCRRRR